MVQSYDLGKVEWSGQAAEKQSQESRKRNIDVTRGQQDVEKTAATLPFAGPQAEESLRKERLDIMIKAKTYGGDLRQRFDADNDVKTYREGMRYYTTALSTPSNSAGDQDLVTLAAKVQDPTGAVMQGDIDRYNNIQVALDRIPQQFRNEFNKSGKFSDETRRAIREFLKNRVLVQLDGYNDVRKSYEADIAAFNREAEKLGIQPLDTQIILKTHPAEIYGDKIRDYADKMNKSLEKEVAANPTGLVAPPPGARISGEDIRGFRFSPRAEAELVEYTRMPDATAEGYGQLLADVANREGLISQDQMADYAKRSAIDNANIFKQTPEQRAQLGSSIDYRAIDKAASENAGLIETVAQAGRNLPESVGQLTTGLGQLTADTLSSVFSLERQGSIKTMTDIAGALLQGDTDDPAVQALGEVLKEQYGSPEGMKRYFIKDPAAAVADISLLLSGSGAGLKAAGATRFGEGLSTAGRIIDPLSGVVALATEAPAAAGKKLAGTPIAQAPAEIAGFPSGIGGATISEAVGAGFERGRTGAPTPRSEGFMRGLTNPEGTAEEVVGAAQGLLAGLRETASDAYRTAMQNFGTTPTPLDIGKVQQRVQSLKPKSYDTWSTRQGDRPADHLAWEKMNSFVDEYAAKAQANPNLLLPLEMDQFKRDVYDIGSKINGAVDSKAAGIAKQTYNAVRQELVKHDPIYADIMRDYEKAANEAQQIERSLSLGDKAGIETASRKLQSIYRNNVNTGYGARTGQFNRLTEADTTGELNALLAGQSASSITPRGINRVAAALPFAAPAFTAVSLPMAVATAPLFSPAAMSTMSYGAGRLAGTGARLGSAAMDTAAGRAIANIPDLYNQNPAAFLAATQGATMLEKTGAEELQARYGAPSVSGAEGLRSAPPEEMVPIEQAAAEVRPTINLASEGRYDPETDTFILPDGTRVDASGNPVEMAHGGPVKLRKGGQPKKQTSWYDDLTMAASRRGNDLVALAADLADKYGMTPAASAAWVASKMGRSPQEVAAIRRNLSGVGNFRNVVEGGAASNEARFRQQGGRGARAPDMVSAPVRLADAAYRPQDIVQGARRAIPAAAQAVSRYARNATPQGVAQDVRRAGSAAIKAISEDPYGMVFDTALYASPATALAAAPFDYASMRGASRELAPYAKGDRELSRIKDAVDAASVLPLATPFAARGATRRRAR